MLRDEGVYCFEIGEKTDIVVVEVEVMYCTALQMVTSRWTGRV